MEYIGAVVSDVGIVKKTNQDSVCLKTACTDTKEQAAMVVLCDGMGGLAKGELASATVVRAFSEWFEKRLPLEIQTASISDIVQEWQEIVKHINQKILQYGKASGGSMGTTLSAMFLWKGEYLVIHIGDSRIYRISYRLAQLTEDQSFVAREVRRGRMTKEQAQTDPRRNMLLQCIGAMDKVEPQIISGRTSPGDVFMFCSDGFWHELTEEELYNSLKPDRLKNIQSMQTTGERLVGMVKARRERDNISVAVIKCEGGDMSGR